MSEFGSNKMPLSDDVVRELKQAVEVRHMHGARSPTSLEWWYFTGHMWKENERGLCENKQGPSNNPAQLNPDYALQATFFLADKQIPKGLLAHAAEAGLAEKKHSHSEIASVFSDSKKHSPLAFAESNFLNIALGHWRLTQIASAPAQLHWDLRFDVKGTEYLLQLEVPKNRVWFHGQRGLVRKTGTSGNFYYSIPFVKARGLRISHGKNAERFSEPVCGRLWFDHEVHVEEVLDVGWKWFGLTFSNRKALMFYEIQTQSAALGARGELWDDTTGRSLELKNVKIEDGPVSCLRSGRCYPQSYRISFNNPQSGRSEAVQTQAAFPEQELDGGGNGLSRIYWEGSTKARWSTVSKRPADTMQVANGLGFTEIVPQVGKK
jgi:predicted secreted hydrolase